MDLDVKHLLISQAVSMLGMVVGWAINELIQTRSKLVGLKKDVDSAHEAIRELRKER